MQNCSRLCQLSKTTTTKNLPTVPIFEIVSLVTANKLSFKDGLRYGSGLDKDLDQCVFHPLLFGLVSISLHI